MVIHLKNSSNDVAKRDCQSMKRTCTPISIGNSSNSTKPTRMECGLESSRTPSLQFLWARSIMLQVIPRGSTGKVYLKIIGRPLRLFGRSTIYFVIRVTKQSLEVGRTTYQFFSPT